MSELSIPMVKYNVYTRDFSWNPNSNTLEPDWSQRDGPAVCVNTQQYSSTTFVWFRFQFQGKIQLRFESVATSNFYLYKIA